MRNEAYRRAVAELPCVCCGLDGHSQAAHANGLEYGKGMGLKADDMAIFPLCCDRPGVVGCHTLFDQGALFSKADRREVTARWISWTRAAVATVAEPQRRGRQAQATGDEQAPARSDSAGAGGVACEGGPQGA